MVTQYPHTLTATVLTDSVMDSEGNYQPPATSTTEAVCRFEENPGSRFIQAADGQQVVYKGVVYMPLGTELPLGVSVEIKDGAQVRCTGEVKQFSKGQLNARA